MRTLLMLVVVGLWLVPMHLLADEPEYKVLAEKQIGGGHALRVSRGPDIKASRLAEIPFLGGQARLAEAYFPLRIDVVTRNAGEVVILNTLWAAAVGPTKDVPERYAGFEVLAIDADQSGVVVVAGWLSNIYAIMVDPQGRYTLHPLQIWAQTVRLSVDAAPGLGKASLAKSADGRWIITTSSGDLGYVYEQTEDRRSLKVVRRIAMARGRVVDIK